MLFKMLSKLKIYPLPRYTHFGLKDYLSWGWKQQFTKQSQFSRLVHLVAISFTSTSYSITMLHPPEWMQKCIVIASTNKDQKWWTMTGKYILGVHTMCPALFFRSALTNFCTCSKYLIFMSELWSAVGSAWKKIMYLHTHRPSGQRADPVLSGWMY